MFLNIILAPEDIAAEGRMTLEVKEEDIEDNGLSHGKKTEKIKNVFIRYNRPRDISERRYLLYKLNNSICHVHIKPFVFSSDDYIIYNYEKFQRKVLLFEYRA